MVIFLVSKKDLLLSLTLHLVDKWRPIYLKGYLKQRINKRVLLIANNNPPENPFNFDGFSKFHNGLWLGKLPQKIGNFQGQNWNFFFSKVYNYQKQEKI